MAYACKICILTKGLKGTDIPSLPTTEIELWEHIESVHHIPVRRPLETPAEALERFNRTYPEHAKWCAS